MGEDDIEIFAAFGDDRCQADNLRTGSYHYDKFQFAVFLPVNI